MGLEDFIKSLANKERQDYPMLPLVQVNEQVGLETDPLKMTQDYQTVNPDTNKTEMTTISNYRPGFFNDLASGYRENVTQGFDINNLAPQNKSWATRIGEGLGTLVRFYDKPIGRMAVATGLSMLTDEDNPLGEGVNAYVGRQTNLTKDKAYRQGLINMGVDEAQVNAIPGIMTDDIYKNIADSYKARWNKVSWADLATISPVVAEAVKANPELANSYLPASVAKEIMRGDLTEAQIANLLARTAKIEAETKQVGKPKVTVNVKQGGTNSTVTHIGGSGGGDRPTKPVDYKNKYGLE